MRKWSAASGTVIQAVAGVVGVVVVPVRPSAIWQPGQVTWVGSQVSWSGGGTRPQAVRAKSRP